MHNKNINTVTNMLMLATNYAIANGFHPINHTDLDENPANFNETLYNIANQINERIEQGINYASIYFNDDLNAFSLEPFNSHDELINDYSDNGNFPSQFVMASFTMPLNNGTLFTLEIIQG